ncbi:hypothetical protein NFI96_021893 [Prochilodus magdalenae]|nr:hypothetical protein NFI96_021893 [Prochilodus magdalenae]
MLGDRIFPWHINHSSKRSRQRKTRQWNIKSSCFARNSATKSSFVLTQFGRSRTLSLITPDNKREREALTRFMLKTLQRCVPGSRKSTCSYGTALKNCNAEN